MRGRYTAEGYGYGDAPRECRGQRFKGRNGSDGTCRWGGAGQIFGGALEESVEIREARPPEGLGDRLCQAFPPAPVLIGEIVRFHYGILQPASGLTPGSIGAHRP